MNKLLVVVNSGDGFEVERPASLADCDDLLARAHTLYRRADKNGSVLQAQAYYAVVDRLLEFRRELEGVNSDR